MDALSNLIKAHLGEEECKVYSIIDDIDLLDELEIDFDARSYESIFKEEHGIDNNESLSGQEGKNGFVQSRVIKRETRTCLQWILM